MLYQLIKPYTSISIIGMCKNAGKTTVLNGLIQACGTNDECIGLTSIGRDGERSDLVTNTKKPEIFIRYGTLAATAEQALPLGSISREIIGVADMPTPMGEVVLVRAMSDGFIQLAGPSMTVQIMKIRDELLALGAKRVFIDGALSRKSLAMPNVSDGTILCSGASYSPDMIRTAEDTAYAAWLMNLPKTERSFNEYNEKYLAVTDDGIVPFTELSAVVDLVKKASVKAILLRGGVTDSVASSLLTAGRSLDAVEIVCEDGSRLLLSRSNTEKLLRAGALITVLNTTRLLAVTVNPFSAYGSHYDKNAFADAVRDRVSPNIPVVNVLEGEANAD